MSSVHRIRLSIANIVFEIISNHKEVVSELMHTCSIFLTWRKPDLKVYLNTEKYQKDKLYSERFSWQKDRLYVQKKYFRAKIDFKQAKVWVEPVYGFGTASFLRFLFSLFAPVRKQGFLLHAAAVSDRGYGYVFGGPSESGKTTIAKLSAEEKLVLTDETAAIVKTNGSYYVWSTPFFGEFGQVKKNIGSPVRAVYFIKKDNRFNYRKLKSSEIVRLLLGNVILGLQDIKVFKCLLDLFESLAKNIPCYELRFKPEAKIWRYVYEFTSKCS